jgi:dolichol-phosphate mannosyltransferase
LRVLVVLPSYNERNNIQEMIETLLGIDPSYAIRVVDDASPDGTSAIVEAQLQAHPPWRDRLSLTTRSAKDGRGGAVRDGFILGLNADPPFDVFVEMDCDFSHEPAAVPKAVALIDSGADVAIGARYPAGKIIGWPRRRRLFSALANRVARLLIDPDIGDYTNGFRAYSPRAVRIMVDRPQRHKGYIYLSESLAYLLLGGMTVTSFPIVFRNRERGVSNTGPREITAAMLGIVSIGLAYRRGR